MCTFARKACETAHARPLMRASWPSLNRSRAPVIRMSHESFYCSILQSNYHLERDFMSKTYIPLELRFIAQTSIHRYIGAVVGLTGDMDGACAFFMPILFALGSRSDSKQLK